MKLLFVLSIALTIAISGCSPKKEITSTKPETTIKQIESSKSVKTERVILKDRVIIKEQGELTKEELKKPKNVIDSPISTDRRKRALGKEQGGPPAPEGVDRKEAEAKRHINTK